MRLLVGLEKPKRGTVKCVKRASVVFQEDRLLPWFSALQNVMVVGASDSAARNVLRALGLTEDEMQALPTHLSGGQQRRVALARALAADSECLLLDEPFNGLDEGTWQNVVPLIAAYAEQKPVVLVTHIREQAEAMGASFIPLKSVPLSGELVTENL
jgi:NitT/TauT family transport system ATP-binding protein